MVLEYVALAYFADGTRITFWSEDFEEATARAAAWHDIYINDLCGMNTNGARVASIVVKFPDGREQELYTCAEYRRGTPLRKFE